MESVDYNARTGELEADGKYPIHFEKYDGGLYFYFLRKGNKHYLTQKELSVLRLSAKWFIENQNCDFGPEVTCLLSDRNEFLEGA